MQTNRYYVITRALNDNAPLLAWDDDNDDFYLDQPVRRSKPVSLKLADPIPPTIEFSDHLWLSRPVIRGRAVARLKAIQAECFQLVPCQIFHQGQTLDYQILNLYRTLNDLIDIDHSDMDFNRRGGVRKVRKVMLSASRLSAIELADRLAFNLQLNTILPVVHQSIKDIFDECATTGIRFVPLAEWNFASAFGE